jgi:hypothetical protein
VRIKATEPGAFECEVFLDGERRDDVVEADTREGWVDVLPRNDRGRLIPPDDPDFKLERRTGVVLVRFSDRGRAIRKAHGLPVES